MTGSAFRFRIVTPQKATETDVHHIRLKDRTGFFGIMKGYTDFLTVLEPSLCCYTGAGGGEYFLAVDGGIFSMREGVATLTSRAIYESDDAEKLAAIIEETIMRRDDAEAAVRGILEGIEKAFLEKSIAFARRRYQ